MIEKRFASVRPFQLGVIVRVDLRGVRQLPAIVFRVTQVKNGAERGSFFLTHFLLLEALLLPSPVPLALRFLLALISGLDVDQR